MGMGGAFLARADDATAASWNPAGLSYLRLPEVSLVGVRNKFVVERPSGSTGGRLRDRFEGRTFESSQCNNLYVFPGVGLGALVAQSTRVTQAMFLAASKSISGMVTPEQEARGLLLPEMTDIREVAFRVALSVARVASEAGLGRRLEEEPLAHLIRKAQWTPQYYPYRAG